MMPVGNVGNIGFNCIKSNVIKSFRIPAGCLCTCANKINWDTICTEQNKDSFISRIDHLPKLRNIEGKASKIRSAVLIPLCHIDKQLSLLYTQRSMLLSNHHGEVSFPGGMCDPTDSGLVETALRETEEEIGFSHSRVDIWGVLPSVPGKNNKYCVTGVIGYIGHVCADDFSINEEEVDHVFAVTLSNLCDPHNGQQTRFRAVKKGSKREYTLPLFVGSIPKVWGMTAILTHFSLLALAPEFYKHRIFHFQSY